MKIGGTKLKVIFLDIAGVLNPDDHSYGEGLQMKHIEQIIKRFGKAKDRKFEHDEER